MGYIFTSPGLASHRWCRLNSNVRHHKRGRAVHQQNQRLRREPNSHEGGIAASRGVDSPLRFVSGNTSYSAPSLWLSLHQSSREPPCQTHGPFFVGSADPQSVPRAAGANAGASGQGALVRRLQSVASHARRRGAGSTCGGPPGVTGLGRPSVGARRAQCCLTPRSS